MLMYLVIEITGQKYIILADKGRFMHKKTQIMQFSATYAVASVAYYGCKSKQIHQQHNHNILLINTFKTHRRGTRHF
jgi:hypothetical protein